MIRLRYTVKFNALCVVAGLLLLNLSFGQMSVSDVKFGLGLRTNIGGMQAFKDVKGYYDDMRPWLSNQMGTSARMVGLEFGLETSTDKGGLALLHVYGVGSNSSASGSNNGIAYKRKIRASQWGLETIDAWYTPIKLGKFNFGGGVMPFGLGIFRVSTKLNDEDRVKPPLSDFQDNFDYSFAKSRHMYAQFHLDFTRVFKTTESAFHFQIFYSLGPKREYELYYLNKEINPSTYTQYFKRSMLKINNFGFKLMLSL